MADADSAAADQSGETTQTTKEASQPPSPEKLRKRSKMAEAGEPVAATEGEEILPEKSAKSPGEGSARSGGGGEKEGKEGETLEKPGLSPLRYSIVALACLGMVVVYCMRTNVGMVAITILDARAHEKVGTLQALLSLPDLNWDVRMIGFLHSIFYLGNLVTHMPGGYLGKVIPCHWLYGGAIAASCALNLLMPVTMESTSQPYAFTCLLRFLQGLSEGLVYPALYGLLRHWSTARERGRLGAIVLTGAYGGAIVGFPLSGFVTHYFGWQYVFWASGGLGLVWWLVWLLASSEKPSHNRFISDKELVYLQHAQGDAVIDYEDERVPWRSILLSLPVIAMSLCNVARQWVFVLMQTNEPYYLNLFEFSVAENGAYSSIPHIVKVAMSLLGGVIADGLMKVPGITTTHIRKLITGIAFLVQAVGFLVLIFIREGVRALVVLTIAVSFGGFAVSGWQINHYDLSTRHASVLAGVTTTLGDIASVAVPLVTAAIVFPDATFEHWNIIFAITSALVGFVLIFFIVFGSGEEQSWAVPPEAVRLVAKADPLAKRPYSLHSLQSPNSAAHAPAGEGTFLMTSAPDSYGAAPGSTLPHPKSAPAFLAPPPSD